MNIIPKPVSVVRRDGEFVLSASTSIRVAPAEPEILAIGQYLAEQLQQATGFALPVVAAGSAPHPGAIELTMGGDDPELGAEGYTLTVTPERVTLAAPRPAGLFHGVQTMRQLLPPAIEASTAQPGPWPIPACAIRDYPRFAWRGVMLDVARHFFGVEVIKRFIDLLAYYKLNRFHLHLTDDQGWRIEIKSWPQLTIHGGSTQVGGGPGGYYTQEDYAAIVAYAAQRYITIVPEIDMPGHTNAALASYAELSCDGRARDLYTGTEVGFSTLCAEKEITYRFVDDVVRELAALTPGEYIHLGGDEAAATSAADYQRFLAQAQAIVQQHGKRAVGWQEMGRIPLLPATVIQHWLVDPAQSEATLHAVEQGASIIMSPASKTYLDMKYDATTEWGLQWAGFVEVRDAYEWDPAAVLAGLGEEAIAGIEGALWTETITRRDAIDFMTFPRLPGLAETGWSPRAGRSWDEYRARLAQHGPRLAAFGVNYYRSPQVPWA